MLKDLPSQRRTTKDSVAPVKISTVEVIERIGPISAFGSAASPIFRNVPSKADIRGSIPLDFSIGDSRVRVVHAGGGFGMDGGGRLLFTMGLTWSHLV